MCPMRVFLLLFSALLAGYFAFRSHSSQPPTPLTALADSSSQQAEEEKTERQNSLSAVTSKLSKGLGLTVDMLSGRYLWQHLKPADRGVPSAKAS